MRVDTECDQGVTVAEQARGNVNRSAQNASRDRRAFVQSWRQVLRRFSAASRTSDPAAHSENTVCPFSS